MLNANEAAKMVEQYEAEQAKAKEAAIKARCDKEINDRIAGKAHLGYNSLEVHCEPDEMDLLEKYIKENNYSTTRVLATTLIIRW